MYNIPTVFLYHIQLSPNGYGTLHSILPILTLYVLQKLINYFLILYFFPITVFVFRLSLKFFYGQITAQWQKLLLMVLTAQSTNLRWYSYKFKGVCLQDKVSVCIQTGWIVWKKGPYPYSAPLTSKLYKNAW
jgi:hypothetical protein